MVNGLHLYYAFIQSALQFMPLIHRHIHRHIHRPTVIGCHARYQPVHQEQLGVRCLAQGHFDTPRVGSNRQPSDCKPTALTSWAISPQQHWCLKGSVLRPVCPGPSVMLWVPFVSRLSAVLCSSPCFLSCPGFGCSPVHLPWLIVSTWGKFCSFYLHANF